MLEDLERLRINVIFSADLYNEGVDIPDVDTVLFLRPTESATIFLQQLGRGLRRTRNKSVLTVLDFVGHHRKEFRFAERFTALTGIPRGHLAKAAEAGFPTLPSGCQIILDRLSEREVLDNLKATLGSTKSSLVKALRVSAAASLTEFLDEQALELSDVCRKGSGGRSWIDLQRAAGRPVAPVGPDETSLLTRAAAFAHVDDTDRHAAYRRILNGSVEYGSLGPADQAFARMLLFTVWPKLPYATYDEALAALNAEPNFRNEVLQILDVVWAGVAHEARRLPGNLAFTPLRSHARYSREELLTALDYAHLGRQPKDFREGVVWSESLATDACLITLRKDEKQFSPTTMYRDYAISRDLFHWESQSRTTVSSPTGQRYVTQQSNGSNVVLFTRAAGTDSLGNKGAPYVCLGTAQYVSHKGEKPIAITYRLDRSMPADVFIEAAVDAG